MNYGQEILNEGLDRLEGEWTYRENTFDLTIENIGYADWRLVKQYAALSHQINVLGNTEDADDIDESDVENVAEQAQKLDSFSWEDESKENDFVETVIEEKLVQPTVDLENTPSDKVAAIIEGMITAWAEAQDVKESREEMPIDKGNR